MSIQDNIRRVREGIASACAAAGRDAAEVTLMAVTKTVDAARVNEALGCGVAHIGENRVQELLGKRGELRLEGVQTHLIGHLQTNKVAQAVAAADMIQSVDSVRLAREIGRCAERAGRVMPVLVEVNIGDEASKSGVAAAELVPMLEEIAQIDHIQVEGLMAIPPILTVEKEKRAIFAKMYRLYIDTAKKKLYNIRMHTLSMGMSGDFREAVMEGSTLVRVGTGIFGTRL